MHRCIRAYAGKGFAVTLVRASWELSIFPHPFLPFLTPAIKQSAKSMAFLREKVRDCPRFAVETCQSGRNALQSLFTEIWNMCVCVCVYIYIYMYIYVYVYVYVYIYL